MRCLTVGADLAVVVTTPDLVAVRDARRTMQMLAQMDCDARLVINRIRPSLMQQGGAPDVDDIIDGVGAQLLGLVPEDALVTPLQNAGVPVIFQTASPRRCTDSRCGAASGGREPASAVSVTRRRGMR